MVNNRVEEVSAKYLVGQHSLESGANNGNREANSVPVGYKQTEVGVIPEDWGVATLGSLGKFKNGINKSAEDFGFGAPFVNLMDVFGKPSIKSAEHLGLINSTDLDKKEYSLFSGDVLFIRSSVKPTGVGLTTVLLSDLRGTVFSGFLIRFRSEARLSNEFKRYCFCEDGFRSRIISGSTVSANTNINQDVLKEILLALPPSLEEQTAIANTLSDVDALISHLESLIAKKQAIKTATMQQLLTGRTRLPQFALREDGSPKGYKQSELGEVPEDWEVLSLRTLLKENPRYGINAAAVLLVGHLPVYIRITDINDDGYFAPSARVGVNSQFAYLYELHDGDIVLARTGASVGKSYLYRKEDGVLVYAGFLIKISPDQSRLLTSFLFQYLKTERYWNWVKVSSMRSGQPGINGNEYGGLLTPIPTIEEQTAIATILSDMDQKIQTLEQRLNKTRQIKQGMMQQLLTGKIRLVKPEADTQ